MVVDIYVLENWDLLQRLNSFVNIQICIAKSMLLSRKSSKTRNAQNMTNNAFKKALYQLFQICNDIQNNFESILYQNTLKMCKFSLLCDKTGQHL